MNHHTELASGWMPSILKQRDYCMIRSLSMMSNCLIQLYLLVLHVPPWTDIGTYTMSVAFPLAIFGPDTVGPELDEG